ncbi:MAG: phosphate acetyltransferase [bacterium]|nr:phosphate acetyltransferase [bacterium]
MKENIFDSFIDKAKNSGKTIVLPEGEDERAIECAVKATKLNIAKIVLLGDEKLKAKLEPGVREKITIINPKTSPDCEKFAQKYFELRQHKGVTIDGARAAVKENMTFAVMMVYFKMADGIVAGVRLKTADVLRPALQIIKCKEGITKASSIMLLSVPKEATIETKDSVVGFADCSVIINPESEDLASIALASAKTMKTLAGVEPKVALLSYSTQASETKDESILKIKQALSLVKAKDKKLVIDGEIQADAAVSSFVSKIKCKKDVLKGQANVFVFPDLNSANISYKLVARFSGAVAVGPIIQGLNAPVNDLSRGATSKEMLLTIAITVLQASV